MEPIVFIILLFLGVNPNCEGEGLCQIKEISQFSKENETPDCDNCIEARIGPYKNGFMIAIPEKRIPPNVFLKYFTKDAFIVEESFVLPDKFCDAFKLKRGYMVNKGSYEFHESKKEILLEF